MLKEGELIGAFAIYARRCEPFTDKQIGLVETFADQAVIAIENARSAQRAAQQRELPKRWSSRPPPPRCSRSSARSPRDLEPFFDTMLVNAAGSAKRKLGISVSCDDGRPSRSWRFAVMPASSTVLSAANRCDPSPTTGLDGGSRAKSGSCIFPILMD